MHKALNILYILPHLISKQSYEASSISESRKSNTEVLEKPTVLLLCVSFYLYTEHFTSITSGCYCRELLDMGKRKDMDSALTPPEETVLPAP